jgi:multidrug efflux pump subunit AcrA (membrane-fusion protein)
MLVKEGDRVTAGQSLARLDTRNLQTQRQQIEAEKARAEAQLVELKAGLRQAVRVAYRPVQG